MVGAVVCRCFSQSGKPNPFDIVRAFSEQRGPRKTIGWNICWNHRKKYYEDLLVPSRSIPKRDPKWKDPVLNWGFCGVPTARPTWKSNSQRMPWTCATRCSTTSPRKARTPGRCAPDHSWPLWGWKFSCFDRHSKCCVATALLVSEMEPRRLILISPSPNPPRFSAGDVEGEAEALLAAGSLHVLQEARACLRPVQIQPYSTQKKARVSSIATPSHVLQV